MRHVKHTPLLPSIVLAGAFLTAVPLSAQELPVSGTFVLDREASDDLEAVVDRGVELVKSWWKRPFARGRIEETNRPYEWTQVSPRDDAVAIDTDQWSLVIPWDGGIEDWERAEDDFVDVEAAVENELLRVVFQGEEGSRTNVYRLTDGGQTLVMDVTITSDQLEEPLAYRLVYRRGRPGSGS